MRQIKPTELADWLKHETREPPTVLDVREPWEVALASINGALHIPMSQIPARLHEIDPGKPVVCVCHHGMRSMQVALFLEHHGLPSIANLSGGIDAWAREADPACATY